MKKYLFLLDVDGVMTTGQFLYSEEGKVFKVFGAHDHDRLNLLKSNSGDFCLEIDQFYLGR